MRAKAATLLVSSLLLAVFLSGCAEGQSQLKSNPLPSVSSISPSTVTLGGQSFSLTVNGSNFLSTSVVRWNGADRATTFVSSSQLTAAILASDLAGAGTTNISVFNPAPGGGTSNSATFTVNNPVPVVSALGPSSSIVGTGAFTLVVDGSNFVSTSVVRWNGSNRATTFVSSIRLTAAIAATDIASAAIANVTVFNATPGGGSSNAMGFTVMPGPLTPVISWFSPASIMAGRPEFTLTVNGSGFVQGSVVRWNGSDRSTSFVNSTQLSATILAIDIASTGTATVTVFNPPGASVSNALAYYLSPPGVGVIERVSVDNRGAQLEDAHSYVGFAGISGDGRFVTFDTTFHNIDPNDPTKVSHQVFARDTCRGAPVACTPTTAQVSVANDGSQGNDRSLWAAISADGRFVAFGSGSSNLVSDDTNGVEDVMLRDTCAGAAGCTPSTTRVSVATDGTQGNGDSVFPSISGNGRFVAFYSEASNLVPNDTNNAGDSFVRDTCFGAPSGCVPSTIRISVANDGSQGNDSSYVPSISATGRFVAFDSAATNLVPGYAGQWDVFVRDTCLGTPAGCTPSTTLVSVAVGSQGNEGAGGGAPVISANGRFVSFGSYSSNLVADDTNENGDVFVRDTCLGAPSGCTPSTTLVSVGSEGSQGNNDSWISYGAPVSGDGRFVAFSTYATNFLPGGNGQLDAFVRDTCAGAPTDCTPGTVRVNVASDGVPRSPNLSNEESIQVAISADGRFVAFDSDANELVSGDTNSCPYGESCSDVFLARTGAVADPMNTSMASSYASTVDSYLPTPRPVVGAVASPHIALPKAFNHNSLLDLSLARDGGLWHIAGARK